MSGERQDVGASCLVVGYDRSESSRAALAWATAELQPNGKLVIVYSCRPLHAPPSPLTSSDERSRLGHTTIDELMLESDPAMLDLDIATEVVDQDPASALLDAAERHGASRIVVGVDEHSRLHQAIGTVITALHKSSPVPVVGVSADGTSLEV
ncbi:MAG TPA: universal stress protein [Solirubrobacteraceae bacterium]|nr:universal stress protein [Solirubrobacteraceae bacterium]